MPGSSLVNLGELTKPISTLIECLNAAGGGLFKPFQIKRIAKAEASASLIQAQATIEITELQARAAQRFLNEETQKQANMEAITSKAIPLLKDTAVPDRVHNDWFVHFLDTCRSFTDNDMQDTWARILAGEVNEPGSYSKRTITILALMSKDDAILFENITRFTWIIDNTPQPLVFADYHPMYKDHGVNFNTVRHLGTLGLVDYSFNSQYDFGETEETPVRAVYFDRHLHLEFHDSERHFQIGHVLFTASGRELYDFCQPKPVKGFFEYVRFVWLKETRVKILNSHDDPINDSPQEGL